MTSVASPLKRAQIGFPNDSVSMTTNETGTEASDEDSIKVCVRIRPHLRDEPDDGSAWCWDKNVISSNALGHAPYAFDHLFYPEHTNEYIFDSVIRNLVLQAMQGCHGSVFTYGQTSSGKTFTMNGNAYQPGIIPQSIYFCFDSIQRQFIDREFIFRVSYIEVYNEQVKDLLSTEPVPIKIQHDARSGNTIVTGVKESVVVNPQQVISLLKAGEAHRHVGSTDMNEKSSRAHTLFKLIIESKGRGDSANAPVRVSNLNLVDLAGSENAKMTNSQGDRAIEAKFINQSLLTLSTIIQRLSEEKNGRGQRMHLPFRDSKLTRLMQTSLSGNATIALICTISPTMRCFDETNNTLKFAARAKKIKMTATVNEVMDDKTLLKVYRREIEQLRARLQAMEQEKASGLIRQPSLSKIMTTVEAGAPPVRVVGGATAGNDDEEEDENMAILQMIAEMEKLILKADLPGGSGADSKPVKERKTRKGSGLGRSSSLSTSSSGSGGTLTTLMGSFRSMTGFGSSPRHSTGESTSFPSDSSPSAVSQRSNFLAQEQCTSPKSPSDSTTSSSPSSSTSPPTLTVNTATSAISGAGVSKVQVLNKSNTSSPGGLVTASGGARASASTMMSPVKTPGEKSQRVSMIKKPGTFIGAAGRALGLLSPKKPATPPVAATVDRRSIGAQTPQQEYVRSRGGSEAISYEVKRAATTAAGGGAPSSAARKQSSSPQVTIKAPSPASKSSSSASSVDIQSQPHQFASDGTLDPSDAGSSSSGESNGVWRVVPSSRNDITGDFLSPSSPSSPILKDEGGAEEDKTEFEDNRGEEEEAVADAQGSIAEAILEGDYLKMPEIDLNVFEGGIQAEPEVVPYRPTSLSRQPSRRLSEAMTEMLVRDRSYSIGSSSNSPNQSADTGQDRESVGSSAFIPGPPQRLSSSSRRQSFSKRRFGFVPSLTLTRTLSKVVEDTGAVDILRVAEEANALGEGGGGASGAATRGHNNAFANDAANLDTTSPTEGGDNLDEGLPSVPEGVSDNDSLQASDDEDDDEVEVEEEEESKVLFGVKELLQVLKLHVAKSSNRRQQVKAAVIAAPDVSEGSGSRNIATTQSGSSNNNNALVQQTSDYDRLQLDYRLVTADNRFLQEELEKKDDMLAMLTQGLREVEISQEEWLKDNDKLSHELDIALLENEELATELLRTRKILEEREKLIEELTGVPSNLM